MVALVPVALVLAACADGGLALRTGGPPSQPDPPGTSTTTTTESGTSSTAPTGDADAVMRAAFEDVERFWTETYPDVYGSAYEPLAAGLHPYGPSTGELACGNERLPYEIVAGNAFYCNLDDFIAWDSTRLIPDVLEQFGPFALAMIMAHEMGHAVQERAGVRGATIMVELQADCFAGAWGAWTAEGRAENFRPDDAAIDNAIAGILKLRDPLGVSASTQGAHGSAFDRVGAFQDGFGGGASRCESYEDGDFEVLDLRFNSPDDFASGGNAPFDEIEGLVLSDIEDYWSTVFPEMTGQPWDPVDQVVPYDPQDAGTLPPCPELDLAPSDYAEAAFYCPTGDLVAWDEATLMPDLYRDIGDFAVATVIAEQYSRAVQHRMNVTGDDDEQQLQADCLTGTWVGSVYRGDRQSEDGRQFALSPGDLDEAVATFVKLKDLPGSEVDLSAFERVEAFRGGFLDGPSAC
jgi:predicted metalloprotease